MLFGASFVVSLFPQAAFRCCELSTMFYMANVTKMLLFVSSFSSQLGKKPPPSCETQKNAPPKTPPLPFLSQVRATDCMKQLHVAYYLHLPGCC